MTPEEQNFIERFVRLSPEELADWEILGGASHISAMPNLPLAVLKQLLLVPWAEVQIHAVERLGESDYPDACDILINVLQNEDSDAQLAAIDVLGRIGHDQHALSVLDALAEPESKRLWDVRAAAIQAGNRVRGRLGDPNYSWRNE